MNHNYINNFVFGKLTITFLIGFIFSIGQIFAQAPYCTPQYSSGCSIGDQIESVSTSGGITNISNLNSGCSPGDYSFIDNQAVTIPALGGFEFTVVAGASWTQSFSIWVDWNDDGDFNDPGEHVWNSGTSGSTFTDSIFAPQGAVSDSLRMRVRCTFSSNPPSDPCASETYGEAEDYIVVVQPGAPDDAGISSIDNVPSGCSGEHEVMVTVENFGSEQLHNVEIHWEVAGDTQPMVFYGSMLDTLGTSNPTSAQVSLGTYDFNDPSQTYVKAWTEMPNGMPDTVNFNDTSSAEVDIIFAIIDDLYTRDVNCYGGMDGEASVTALGGIEPVTFYWSTGDTGATVSTLPAGTHQIVLEDDFGCRDTTEVNIGEPQELEADVVSGGATCQSTSLGKIEVEASGGIPPYSYNWSNGSKRSNLNNVNANTYRVTVTDSNSCTKVLETEIKEVQILRSAVDEVTPANCGSEEGTASVSVSGGLPPYDYEWSDGQTSESATGLAAGSYQVTVTDDSGCEIISNISVPEFDFDITHHKPSTLATDYTGGSLQWINCETGEPVEGANDTSFSPSSPGSYALRITSGSCSETSGCFDIIYTSAADRSQKLDVFKLYPNPNSGTFQVELHGNLNNVELELFDLQGKMIMKKAISESGHQHIEQFNQSLGPGMYLLKVVQDQNAEIKRFVVK